MPTKLEALLAVTLVLLAFFAVWLWDLGYPALSGDESYVAILTAQPAGEILQRLNSDEPHPPIYYLLMHTWQSVAGGRPEFIVRFPSLLVGMLLLSLTYRLGRDLGMGHWTALVPVILIGFFPQMTLHIREARMYGLMAATVAALLVVGLRFDRLTPRFRIGIAAAVALLALFTHYFNALFVAAIGLAIFLRLKKPIRWRWLISQAIAWGLFAVWLPTMGRGFFNPTSLNQGKTWSFILPPWEALAGIIKTGLFGYRDRVDVWLVILGSVLLIGAWLLGALTQRGRDRWLLLLCAAAPLLAYVLIAWFKPIFHPKYTLPWLLFAALAVGLLITRWPRFGGSVFVALLVLMATPLYRTVRMPYDPGLDVSPNARLQTLPRDLGAELTRLAGPTDVLGIGTPDDTLCYYANRYFDRKLGCVLIPQYPAQSVTDLDAQLDGLFGQHAVLWYLDYYNPAWDPQHTADAALARHAVNLGEEQIAGQHLRLYTSPGTIAHGQQSIGTRFDDVAELEGVWLVPGSDWHVVLTWRSLADHPQMDVKVFLHLVDSAGQIVAQEDSVPVQWTRPLASWQRGEQILDVHTLAMPKELNLSDLKLRVGLYDASTAQRLAAYNEKGEPLPDNAVIIPFHGVMDSPAFPAAAPPIN